MPTYDVAVVGLGAFGSATLYHLARKGLSVIGFDRHRSPHRFGSTHGQTRVTRAAIGEGPEYSRLAIDSHSHWRKIEGLTGRTLFDQCGCLFIPPITGGGGVHGVENFFKNIEIAAQLHNIPVQRLTDAQIRERYPALRIQDGEQGLFDPEGGYLFVEDCVSAQLELAGQHGAQIVQQEATFDRKGTGVTVRTKGGEEFHARRGVLTTGPWLPATLGPSLRRYFRVTRQVLHWFEIAANPEQFLPQRFPTYIWDVTDRETDGVKAATDVYGFPLVGPAENGIKIAAEDDEGAVDPDAVSRIVTAGDIAKMYNTYVKPYFRDIGPRSLRTEVCLYTRVPKGRFVIDAHPEYPHVIFASPCSGHGFKHSAAVGAALAQAASTGIPVDAIPVLAPFTLEKLCQCQPWPQS